MSQSYPDIITAQNIWQDGIDFRLSRSLPWPTYQEYIVHTTGVADSARKIAEKTPYLNADKAYVLGLLHDYGKKYDERASGKFHVQIGYEELLAMGYSDSARICLTHSFPVVNFNDKDYSSYRPEWLAWAHQALQNVKYDDYDRLIQLCDLFFEGMSKVGFEERFAGIARRYGLCFEQTAVMRECAVKNKAYFDGLCGTDIYQLLNISVL